MRMRVALTGMLAVAVLGLSAARPRAAEGPYQLIKDIQIGGEGGWDYLNVDSAALYNARGAIYSDMGVLNCASDLDEVAGICHRALIFNRGRIVEELQRSELSVARLTGLVGGATQTSGAR